MLFMYLFVRCIFFFFFFLFTVRQKRKGASEVKWLKTVLSSGTLSDKMAALTLLVQVSPPTWYACIICTVYSNSRRIMTLSLSLYLQSTVTVTKNKVPYSYSQFFVPYLLSHTCAWKKNIIITTFACSYD